MHENLITNLTSKDDRSLSLPVFQSASILGQHCSNLYGTRTPLYLEYQKGLFAEEASAFLRSGSRSAPSNPCRQEKISRPEWND